MNDENNDEEHLRVTDRRSSSGSQTDLEREDAARRERASARKTSSTQPNTVQIAIGVTVLVVLVGLVFNWCTGALTEQPFSGRIEDWSAFDDANLAVWFELTNDGDEPAKGECTIEAHDLSRVTGWDVFSSTSEIAPGETETLRADIRIEDEGATRVIDVTIKDCGEAS